MKSQKEIFDELNKKWDDEKESNKRLKALMIFNSPFEVMLREHRRVISAQLAEMYKEIGALRKRICEK